jgi:purine-nucleoside phosphorylase
MTPHNSAQPGDYAEAVLLPGDPLRAKWIAEKFFDNARQVNAVRNCLGFTGTWKGRPVSVQATGMGQPSLSIYVHELLNFYGVKAAIRVGTCGGLSTRVKLRELIIAQAATTDSTIVRDAFGPYNFAPIADFDLLADAVRRARAQGLGAHVGNLLSSDIFYHADGMKAYETLIAHGVLGVEMEAAALYTLCARFGARGLAICTMTDSLVSSEQLSAAERQSSLEEMITLALDVAVNA